MQMKISTHVLKLGWIPSTEKIYTIYYKRIQPEIMLDDNIYIYISIYVHIKMKTENSQEKKNIPQKNEKNKKKFSLII